MLYDGLLLVALWMVTTGVYLLLMGVIVGQDTLRSESESGALDGSPTLSAMLFLVSFFFFAYFWRKLGQTLGMQAWRICVVNEDGSQIRWLQCLLRFFMALLSLAAGGLGYWWAAFDPEQRTWHDRYSMTRTVLLPARSK